MTAPAGIVGVEFRATGIEAVRRGAAQVTQSADQMQSKFGGAARQVAGSFQQMAAAGKATGDSLKQIAASGAEMAFMFGPHGAIAGAAAIGVLAIVTYFQRARQEMDETRRKYLTDLEQMARAGALGPAADKAQQLYSGDRFALRKPGETDAQYRARRFGLEGVRGRIDQLRGELPSALLDAATVDGPVPFGYSRDQQAKARELRGLVAELSRMKREYSDTYAIVQQLTAAETRRAQVLGVGTPRGAAPGRQALEADALLGVLPALRLIGQESWSIAQQQRMHQEELLAEYLAVNTTLERRLAIERELATAAAARQPHMDKVSGATWEAISEQIRKAAEAAKSGKTKAFEEIAKTRDELVEQIQAKIGDDVGNALASAFQRAFNGEGLAGFFKGFGQTILSSLGEVFTALGKKLINFGAIATAIEKALKHFGIFSGPAAIAAGVALMALGAGMGAMAGGMGGGGGSGGGYGGGYGGAAAASTQIIDRGLINPVGAGLNVASQLEPRAPVTLNATIIGENDPRAQSALKRMIDNANRRGSL